jgi:EAL and modified HD-GYP domain-containing signal transduction protein
MGVDMDTVVRDTVFVARQPIFDKDKTVRAYELLFRSGLENRYTGTSGDMSTMDLIASSLLVIGLDELTGQKRAFVNFTRNLLLQDVASLLPSDQVTIEIIENIEPDNEVIAACRKLKDAGYKLAMDDFVLSSMGSPFLEIADIVKVDFCGMPPDDRRRIADDLARRNIAALAEKVETVEDFDAAVAAGYAFFQGYFFSKPVIRTGSRITSNRLNNFRLLHEVSKPDFSYDQMEDILKQDVALTYHLLKYINSVWFSLRHEVTGVKHALVLLGPGEVRKWAALMSLRNLSNDKPSELFLRSITRARMGESLAPHIGLKTHASDLFLMGMFSLIDGLLDMPMAEILPKLPLARPVSQALLGQPGDYLAAKDAIVAYEKGNWDMFTATSKDLRLNTQVMPALFSDSLRWATDALGSISTA